MGPSEPTWHVSRVQKRVLKFVNFIIAKTLTTCDHCVPSLLQVETHASTIKCMRQKKRKSNSAKAAYRSFSEK